MHKGTKLDNIIKKLWDKFSEKVVDAEVTSSKDYNDDNRNDKYDRAAEDSFLVTVDEEGGFLVINNNAAEDVAEPDSSKANVVDGLSVICVETQTTLSEDEKKDEVVGGQRLRTRSNREKVHDLLNENTKMAIEEVK